MRVTVAVIQRYGFIGNITKCLHWNFTGLHQGGRAAPPLGWGARGPALANYVGRGPSSSIWSDGAAPALTDTLDLFSFLVCVINQVCSGFWSIYHGNSLVAPCAVRAIVLRVARAPVRASPVQPRLRVRDSFVPLHVQPMHAALCPLQGLPASRAPGGVLLYRPPAREATSGGQRRR